MPDPLQVLILEDSPIDAELELHELRRAGFEPTWTRVQTEAEFIAQLRPNLDLIIADYQLPQFTGVRALACLRKAQLSVPFIIVSGAIGEELAVELMREGATDYLLKDRLARLGAAVRRALDQRRDRQIRAEAERERERLAEKVIYQARTFDTLLSAVPDLLILINADRRLSYANRAALDAWGVTLEGIVGKRIEELELCADATARLSAALDEALLGRTVRNEGAFLPPSEAALLYEYIVSPVTDGEGIVIAVACAGRDMTERAAAEARIRGEREMRELFISTLSHDMRTPMTAVKLSAELLMRKNQGDEASAKLHSRIIENTDRVDDMIQTLLDADLVRAGGRLSLNMQTCGLRRTAQIVIEELSALYGDRYRLFAPAEVEGLWDCRLVRRILENLLSNAVKHGDPAAPVSLNIQTEGCDAILSVHNQGAPIPSEDHAILFEPFRRASSERNSNLAGWGLGLSMVRAGAEAHGGSVSVSSSRAEGTTFSVRLPMSV
ncbi:ATP-binding protein [Pseudomonas stutzeri]|uniref:sensor histidine kinase n=1 Tax=Stutzerimonas stutzeri TaxID=316 RepID=UPI002109B5EE|nr:ATP-binding protein [Stutzerimonas stutzeri]MCQ4313234.1 ATP-binding protein [Stutzerimonas stutzeri]